MTFYTNRNYIKLIFECITGVMIFLGLLKAVMTLLYIRPRQFACSHSIAYSLMRLKLVRITDVITFLGIYVGCFTFIALTITFNCSTALFCISMFFLLFRTTGFAFTQSSFFHMTMNIKFRKGFCFFANTASFCYNWFRHNRFLNKRFCLEPTAAHTAIGLFYNTNYQRNVKSYFYF